MTAKPDRRIEPLTGEAEELATLFADEAFVEFRHLPQSVGTAEASREFWVLRTAGELAGVLLLDLGLLDLGPRPVAELTLAVASGQRGQGHGRALLAFAMQRAQQRGIEVLRVCIDEANVPARAFFASAGFSRQDGGPEGHVTCSIDLGQTGFPA